MGEPDAELRCRPSHPDAEGLHAFLLCGLVLHLGKGGIPLVPQGVWLRWDAVHTEGLAEWIGCPVHVGGDDSFLRLSAADLDRPLPFACKDFLAFFDRQLRREPRPTTTRDAVEAVLESSLPDGSALHLPHVSARLGMSERSLQRALDSEGTTFQEVLDELRRRLACRALQRGRRVGETAFSLGFAHPGSFVRAFRRWTGMAPGEWRQSVE